MGTKQDLSGLSRFAARLVLFCAILTLSFEVLLRIVGNVNDIGQYSIGGVAIPPFVIDIETIRQNAAAITASNATVEGGYNEDIGYTLRPNINQGNMIIINSQGIRTSSLDKIYSQEPLPGVLRIALIGDSNIHGGARVTYEETWGYALEQGLNARGIPTEVLNFGVPNYSPTQSELRWEYDARPFQPDFVLFGSNNRLMTVAANMHRSFIMDNKSPFIAPLYYLDGDELRLVNHPAPAPSETADILANFENHPLHQYENHYNPHPLWSRSRFLSVLWLSFSTSNPNDYNMNSVDIKTFIAIMDYFAESVEEADARFVFAHLAVPNSIRLNVGEGRRPHQPILDDLASRHLVVDTMDLFPYMDRADWNASHYAASAGQRVGLRVADVVEACLNDASCAPPRFREEQ